MKRQVHFLFPCLLVLLTVLTACEDRGDEHLFCDVTLMTSLPDGRSIVRMEADASLAGTFLRNVNNRQEYDFPLFVNNRGTVRVQKGVYLISFDARAHSPTGRRRGYAVRNMPTPRKPSPCSTIPRRSSSN